MKFPFQKKVKTENETINVAEEFAKILKPGDFVLLNGDLGSGKTFFVKNICAHYGILNVSSPSFSIINEYHNGKNIIHFDFYRVKKIEELYDIGFEDYLLNDEAVIFIEWAELFTDILPSKNYEIEIKFTSDSEREIKIEKHD
jgi:tRNA threonylcarbamoyladenosine biosynthesis protein TsaE